MTFTETEIPHGGIRDFRQKLTKNTPHTPPKLELLMEDVGNSNKPYQEYLLPLPKMELLMEDLGTSRKSLPRIPFTQTGIPYGGIRDFRQKLTKNTPQPPSQTGTSHGGRRDFV